MPDGAAAAAQPQANGGVLPLATLQANGHALPPAAPHVNGRALPLAALHVNGRALPLAALHVNGRALPLAALSGATLLTVLRNDAGCNGPKYGCGLGQCGACMVLIDGRAARACAIPAAGVAGRAITTLDGLGTPGKPHPVQQAFIDEQAAQCGYCLNGMVMATVALLAHTPQPSDAQARNALSHNLCRCGAHVEILRAVQRAAVLLRRA